MAVLRFGGEVRMSVDLDAIDRNLSDAESAGQPFVARYQLLAADVRVLLAEVRQLVADKDEHTDRLRGLAADLAPFGCRPTMSPVKVIDYARTAILDLTTERDESARDRALVSTLAACADGETWDEAVARVVEERDEAVAEVRRLTGELEREAVEARALQSEEGSAATLAFDAIATACGCPHWDYPGQVVRDVLAVVEERDEARVERDEATRRLAVYGADIMRLPVSAANDDLRSRYINGVVGDALEEVVAAARVDGARGMHLRCLGVAENHETPTTIRNRIASLDPATVGSGS